VIAPPRSWAPEHAESDALSQKTTFRARVALHQANRSADKEADDKAIHEKNGRPVVTRSGESSRPSFRNCESTTFCHTFWHCSADDSAQVIAVSAHSIQPQRCLSIQRPPTKCSELSSQIPGPSNFPHCEPHHPLRRHPAFGGLWFCHRFPADQRACSIFLPRHPSHEVLAPRNFRSPGSSRSTRFAGALWLAMRHEL
jgi:hypothetical protein